MVANVLENKASSSLSFNNFIIRSEKPNFLTASSPFFPPEADPPMAGKEGRGGREKNLNLIKKPWILEGLLE